MDSYGTVKHSDYSPSKGSWTSSIKPGVISVLLGVVVLVFISHRQNASQTKIQEVDMSTSEEQVPLGGTIVSISSHSTLITVYLPMQPPKTFHVNTGVAWFVSFGKIDDDLSGHVKSSLLPTLKKAKAVDLGPPFAVVKVTGKSWSKLSKVQKKDILQGAYDAIKEAGFQYAPQWFNYDVVSSETTSPSVSPSASPDYQKALGRLEQARRDAERQLQQTEQNLKAELQKAANAASAQLGDEQKSSAKNLVDAFKQELENLKKIQDTEIQELKKALLEKSQNVSSKWEQLKATAISADAQTTRQALKNQTLDLLKELKGLESSKEQEEKSEEQVEKENQAKLQALEEQIRKEQNTLTKEQLQKTTALKKQLAEERRQFWVEAQSWTDADWTQVREKWEQLLNKQHAEFKQAHLDLKTQFKNVTSQEKQQWAEAKTSGKETLQPYYQKLTDIDEQIKDLEAKAQELRKKSNELDVNWLQRKEESALRKIKSQAAKTIESEEDKEETEQEALNKAKIDTLKKARETYEKEKRELEAKWKSKWEQLKQETINNSTLPEIERELEAAKKKLATLNNDGQSSETQ